ncbi:MAG: cupin domain-containing protein [Thermoplasmata archaeon]|nr:cupin domain-containing protein [Thermoplasmata archaeon]
MVEKVNLDQKLGLFADYWSPKIVAEVNDSNVKVVKLKGEFDWHSHEKEDELFLVLKGQFRLCLRSGDLVLRVGDLAVVPRGVEHKPVADEEAHVLLLEPKTTVNTGSVRSERTVAEPERI